MTPPTVAPATRTTSPSRPKPTPISPTAPLFTSPADDAFVLDDTAALLTERPPLSFEDWRVRLVRRVRVMLETHGLFDDIPKHFTAAQIRWIVNLRITLIVYVYESWPTPRTTPLQTWLIRAAHADPHVAAAVLRLYCNTTTPPQ